MARSGKNSSKNSGKNSNKNKNNNSKTQTNSTKTNATKATEPFKETVKAGSKTTSEGVDAWNKAIQAKIDDATARGKDVSYDYDDNGALHYTTYGKDRLNSILNDYNTNSTSTSSPTYNTNGLTYTIKSKAQSNAETAAEQQAALAAAEQTGYDNAMAQYQNIYSTQQADVTAALKNAYAANAEQINTNYDNAARNYYQLYKTQQAQLPENLSKLGVTGGASESAQIDLLNTYSNNLYNNESNRNNQLANANQNYNDKIAENSANVANSMASAYLQMAQQQLQYQREDEQAAAEKQAAAEETAAAQAVEKWNTNVRNRMAQQLAKGDTIWYWEGNDGKLHWSTYQSVGLANGGTELSGSNYKKKIVSDSSSSSSTKYYKVKDDPEDEPKASSKVTGYGAYQVSDEYYNKVLKNAKALALTPMTQERAVDYVVNDSGLPEWHQKKILTEIGLL